MGGGALWEWEFLVLVGDSAPIQPENRGVLGDGSLGPISLDQTVTW